MKADASGVPITVSNADHPADITFSVVTTDINRATKAPVAIPVRKPTKTTAAIVVSRIDFIAREQSPR